MISRTLSANCIVLLTAKLIGADASGLSVYSGAISKDNKTRNIGPHQLSRPGFRRSVSTPGNPAPSGGAMTPWVNSVGLMLGDGPDRSVE